VRERERARERAERERESREREREREGGRDGEGEREGGGVVGNVNNTRSHRAAAGFDATRSLSFANTRVYLPHALPPTDAGDDHHRG
jgi:hypothetical protein